MALFCHFTYSQAWPGVSPELSPLLAHHAQNLRSRCTPRASLSFRHPAGWWANSWSPKSAVSAISKIGLVLSGLQDSVGPADSPSVAPVLLSPQIHPGSPVSQKLGFTRQNRAAEGPLLGGFLVINRPMPPRRQRRESGSFTAPTHRYTPPSNRRIPDLLPWTASGGQPKAERMARP